MADISVIIHTKNAADTVERAIKSVLLWASEILVIDMKSDDNTVEIAKGMGAKVVSVADAQFADPARQLGLERAKGPWIFVLDADEEIPKTLAAVLQQLSENFAVQAYEIPRKNMIFGQWAHTGWWPDYIIRFFQKGTVTWPGRVHALPEAKGTVVRLEAKEEYAIIHHNYESVEQFITRLNRYTSLEAEQKQKDAPLMKSFFDEFERRYFLDEGVLQGQYGYALSLLQAIYMLVAQVKRMEHKGFSVDNAHTTMVQVEQELDEVYRDLCYWIADMHVKHDTSFFSRFYWKVRRKFNV